MTDDTLVEKAVLALRDAETLGEGAVRAVVRHYLGLAYADGQLSGREDRMAHRMARGRVNAPTITREEHAWRNKGGWGVPVSRAAKRGGPREGAE